MVAGRGWRDVKVDSPDHHASFFCNACRSRNWRRPSARSSSTSAGHPCAIRFSSPTAATPLPIQHSLSWSSPTKV